MLLVREEDNKRIGTQRFQIEGGVRLEDGVHTTMMLLLSVVLHISCTSTYHQQWLPSYNFVSITWHIEIAREEYRIAYCANKIVAVQTEQHTSPQLMLIDMKL